MWGSGLGGWLTPYPCWACTVVVLLHVQKHLLKPGWSHINRFMLDHFQQLVVILYNDMPAIEVGVEFLQTEAY